MASARLSENFGLDEFTLSQEAVRRGIDNSVEPGSETHKCLKRLCNEILEPLRAELGAPIRITSGYRCPKLNVAIKGAPDSQHMSGQAADIVAGGKTPLQVCRAVKKLGLPYDQLIHEFGVWCHVSVAAEGAEPRQQDLTAAHGPKRITVYTSGLKSV